MHCNCQRTAATSSQRCTLSTNCTDMYHWSIDGWVGPQTGDGTYPASLSRCSKACRLNGCAVHDGFVGVDGCVWRKTEIVRHHLADLRHACCSAHEQHPLHLDLRDRTDHINSSFLTWLKSTDELTAARYQLVQKQVLLMHTGEFGLDMSILQAPHSEEQPTIGRRPRRL